jgi:hypothetical protein
VILLKSNRFVKNDRAFTNLVPLVLAVVITFAILFIGGYVNGQIDQSLIDSMPAAGSRSILQNNTISTMDNISGNWDSSLDIVQVTIIISILAGAVAAIFLFTRFR